MSFANQKSVLLHDDKGNIYNIYWNEGKIIFNFFDKSKGKYENNTVVDGATMEFDCLIDKGEIYLILQKNNGQLLLMTRKDASWDTSELSKENQPEVYNLNIVNNKTLHIIYCVSSYENKSVYRMYHHYLDNNEWKTQQVVDIRVKSILNPFQIIKTKDEIIVGFYDFHEIEEQIFIKKFDAENRLWKNAIRLTSGDWEKLYLDVFMQKPNIIHLTYSEFYEGNLIVKYEKYKLSDQKAIKVLEEKISNPTNCSHPTFIWMKERLWVCWTEHDQVSSCYSMDEGLTWSNPYLWKESKSINFFRHKFETNDENIKAYYSFNNAFGKGYPEYSFIGFGDTAQATEIAINKKKNTESEGYKEEKNQPKTNIKEIKSSKLEVSKSDEIEKLEKLAEDLKRLEERIDSIEDYINRRRRGLLFNPRNN